MLGTRKSHRRCNRPTSWSTACAVDFDLGSYLDQSRTRTRGAAPAAGGAARGLQPVGRIFGSSGIAMTPRVVRWPTSAVRERSPPAAGDLGRTGRLRLAEFVGRRHRPLVPAESRPGWRSRSAPPAACRSAATLWWSASPSSTRRMLSATTSRACRPIGQHRRQPLDAAAPRRAGTVVTLTSTVEDRSRPAGRCAERVARPRDGQAIRLMLAGLARRLENTA